MIENFKTAGKITIALGVLLIVSIVFYIFSFFEPYHRKIYLVLGTLSLLTYIFILLRKIHYFAAFIDKNNLIIRFYNPHPLMTNYQQIKIPLNEYDGYELKKGLFTEHIIFKIRRGKQTGKYPPVSIAGLSKEQKQELMEMLKQLKRKK